MSVYTRPPVLMTAVVVMCSVVRGADVNSEFAEAEPGWDCLYPVDEEDLSVMRDELISIVDRTYSNYIQFAFPMDNLDPISCTGSNMEGGIALTLLDTLDTLILMGQERKVKEAVKLIKHHVRFDVDHLANVFEVNIRALGGLLSAHILIKRHPTLATGYDNSLLTAAADVGTRLINAFSFAGTLPVRRINMKHGGLMGADGVIPADVVKTCTACAGTLILEMGMLSRLSGIPVFEEKAKGAIEKLFSIRTSLGLVGSDFSVLDGTWINPVSSIGANSDSFYEYLLKAYLLFGDSEYLEMFSEVYSAAMHYMKTPELIGGYRWMVDVDMTQGSYVSPWICALSAFWPGLQATIGQLEEAVQLYSNYTDVWRRFAGLPELFFIDGRHMHPNENRFGLRPELIESTFILHASTNDPHYLQLGRMFQKNLFVSRTRCGHSEVSDISTGQLDDSMPSFFLAESLKYLYLLNSNATSLVDAFVFTTEAHLLPPLPNEGGEAKIPGEIPDNCRALCREWSLKEEEGELAFLRDRFPLVGTEIEEIRLLRRRRCIACARVATSVDQCAAKRDPSPDLCSPIDWAVVGKKDVDARMKYVVEESGKRMSFAQPFSCVQKEQRHLNDNACCKAEAFHRKATSSRHSKAEGENEIRPWATRYGRENVVERLVLGSEQRWIELDGKFMTRHHHPAIDYSATQYCASKLLYLMTVSKEEARNKDDEVCRSQAAFGDVELISIANCDAPTFGRYTLQNTIAVIDIKCPGLKAILEAIDIAEPTAIVLTFVYAPREDLQPVVVRLENSFPIFLVSSREGNRVREFLFRNPNVKGFVGRTTAFSLTTCRHLSQRLEDVIRYSRTCIVSY